MKTIQTCFVIMTVALVVCVSYAGLFDAIKSVTDEAVNVADEMDKVSDMVRGMDNVTNGPINQFLNGEFKIRYSKIKPDYDSGVLAEINDYVRDRGVSVLVLVQHDAQYGFFDQRGKVSSVGLSQRSGCQVNEQVWVGHAMNWLSARERDYEEAKHQAQLAAKAEAAEAERRIAAERAEAEARQHAENARKAKQAKVVASLSAWEHRLKELGYTEDGIKKLMPRIENLLSQSEFGECREKYVMDLLNIRDQREVAKDAAAAKKINLDDPKTLTENDKIIIAHIDQELVPRLRFNGPVSKQELDQLKINFLEAIHKVPEENQVQTADFHIKEMIRMHNL